jgi:fructan beta-fructosidase
MLQKMILPLRVMLALCVMAVSPSRAVAGAVMNYGADGNDYFQFTTPSLSLDKASGFTTLIAFAMHVNPDGTLLIGGVACTNGVYVGPTNWSSLVTALKAPPTTVTRYEVCIGGWQDTSYANVKSLVASQGTGPGSMLYKNFQALKNAVPGIDAINDDDEQTYDLNSSTNFANMLGGLGYKFTLVPYQNQSFWVNLKNSIANCDYIYLQCYEGGAGNDPGQWDSAFGNGVVVIPGQESNTANPATFHSWYLENGVQGGFYYPDVVFNSTYWSAAIIEGNGAVPGAPTGLVAIHGENEAVLSWNTVPGAISYNVKRSTSSGGEATIANVSTANNNWPASNQYSDTGLTIGKAYYYKVSAVNTNGESLNSVEVSATPPAAATWTGLGSDNNWGTGGNWNTAPSFPTGLIFAGNTQLVNSNNLSGITVNSLTFNAAAGAFVLGGTPITLTGNIGFSGNPAAAETQTVDLDMAWNSSEYIDTPANGNLSLGGNISSSTDSSLIKVNTGGLTLGGTNTITSWDLDGGTTTLTGSTTINGDGNSRIYVGNGDYLADCSGTLVIQPGALLNIIGNYADDFVIGRDSGSGTVSQNGGTFIFNNNRANMWVGATGNSATRAVYNMNGGLLDMTGHTFGVGLGAGVLITGLVNQVSGVITNVGNLWLGGATANGYGAYSLSGGSIYIGAGGITTYSGLYRINLGGGTVGAETSWSSPLNMNLTGSNGPVTFDTSTNTITLSGTLSGSGGLIKAGSGTLILSGKASYLGNTTVKAGTLELNLAGSSPSAFYLSNGASLELTSGGTFAVGVLYTNNVALPNGVYTSSNLQGFITGPGSLQVVSIDLSYLLNGSNLTLSWPTNYLGWILQEQTDNLDAGLSTNWVDIAGSANATTTSIQISPANPAVFFRLSPPPPPSIPPLTRQMFVTNNLLNLPVNNNGPSRRVTITVGGIPMRDFNINLADGAPNWWAFVDVSAFQGQTATVTVNNLSVGSTGLSFIVQSNGIVDATNLYSESLRPQLHYSSKRGWLNDANGMIYYQGQYHLYYQHDPFNYNGADQKFWGHAVSPDMVHWQELPEAIYPYAYGDWVWSGSAVIDSANSGGFQSGTNAVIIAPFYSTARGQCIDYSTDGGLTFTNYIGNPVVNVAGRDPHMLWYAPSNYWVMAVYDSNLGGIDFFSTPDFHQWTYRSGIAGFYECPDLFELPVDGNTNNMLWELNDGSTGYMLGQFNGAVFTPTTAKLPGNNGSGFYASQTFTTMPPGDTRRVRIGWAQISMPGMPFNQMMFFPTVLTLQTLPAGVRLCSSPIAEISNAVENTYSWTNLTLNPGYNPLSGVSGQLFDVQAQFIPGSASAITFNLCGVSITYTPASQQITCDGNTQSLPPLNGIVNLEIITDRQSVEIFGNSGQLYMPIGSTSYSSSNQSLSLTSQGASTVFNSLKVNQLQSIWSGVGN